MHTLEGKCNAQWRNANEFNAHTAHWRNAMHTLGGNTMHTGEMNCTVEKCNAMHSGERRNAMQCTVGKCKAMHIAHWGGKCNAPLAFVGPTTALSGRNANALGGSTLFIVEVP